MKNQSINRRFKPLQQKISALKKNNSRFKKVYREFEIMSDELWNLENSSDVSVSDDFLDAVNLQTTFLQDEIEDWLQTPEKNEE